MPAILRIGRFRFFPYSNERGEPPHIHVRAGGEEAKFWLDPIELAANYGFNGGELREIERLVAENGFILREGWNGHLGGSGSEE